MAEKIKDHHTDNHSDSHSSCHAPHFQTTPLGASDVLVGGIVFYLFTLGIYKLCSAAVPGLLTPETLLDIQISGGLFLVLWLFLGNLIFKPFLELIEQREERTLGDEQRAQANLKQKKELESKLASELRNARLKGIEERDQKVLEGKRLAQEIIDEAQRENADQIQYAQQEIRIMREAAFKEVVAEADKLANLVAERALAVSSTSRSIH
jgi:F-type H+-transporting ATPase subunit b